MPFNTTRIIPTGWSAHHQPAMTTSHNATVTITDPARTTPGVFDPDTMTSGDPVEFVVATNQTARVQRLKEENVEQQAAQDVPTRMYLIQLVADIPGLQVGYEVTIDTATNDAELVGATMAVEDVQHGSERFTRDIVARHNQQPVRAA